MDSQNTEASRNAILALVDAAIGREVSVCAGQRLRLDGETVWFPVSALVRNEVGSSGIIAGWANDESVIGLVECLHVTEEVDPWIVVIAGTAVEVPSTYARMMLERSSAFRDAAMISLNTMACDARRIAASHITEKAGVKIAKLLLRLDRASQGNDRIAVNQSEIARWLGLQRTTVCAVMLELKRQKLINYARTNVAILNRDGMRDGWARE